MRCINSVRAGRNLFIMSKVNVFNVISSKSVKLLCYFFGQLMWNFVVRSYMAWELLCDFDENLRRVCYFGAF
jgi:hypothetical protein